MKGTLSYASASFGERLVSFFLLPLLTKLLTPTEYAIWSQSIIVAGVLLPVILLKLDTSLIKFFPTFNNHNIKKNSVLLFMLTLILILFLFIATISLVFEEQIAFLIFGNYKLSLYVPLIICLLLTEILFEFLIALLRISNRVGKVSIYILLKGIWRLGTLSLVLLGINSNFYFAFCTFVLVQLIITSGLFLWDINPFSLLKAGFNSGRNYWYKILKFSLPLVPFIILMMIHNFIDRIFITHLLGLNSLALYTAGFSIAVVVTFFHSTISFMLFPELSRKWNNKNKANISFLMKKVVTAYLALTLPFLIFILVAGVEVLLALTTKDYLISTLTLFIISLNMGVFGFFQFAHYIVLLSRGSLSAPILMTFITGINIILNLLFIPKIGILGAALSSLISTFILAVIVYIQSQKNLMWKFPFLESVRILIRSLIMGAVILFGINWLGNDIISLTLTIIISGFVYILLDFFGDKDSSFIALTELGNFDIIKNFLIKTKKISNFLS